MVYAYAIIDWKNQKVTDKGIVQTWGECQSKTFRIKGSRSKKFNTEEEAQEWLKKPIIVGKKNFYAVHSAVCHFVFSDYVTLIDIITYHQEHRVELRYKGFEAKQEADSWLRTFEN